jgi:hypothetical protein
MSVYFELLEAASRTMQPYEPKASTLYQIPVVLSVGENFFMSNFVKKISC